MNSTIDDSALGREVAFLNARVAAVAASAANAALAPLGLKVRSYSVLSLAAESSAPSQRDLAETLLLDPSQVVALVDDLEQRGLVTRVAHQTDRRIKAIVASAKGRDVCAAAARATMIAENEAFKMLDSDERLQLANLLRKVARGG
jgi:DNA-binding MarR family transcriptional regulator